MALSNVEKKVGVTVTVDASQAVKGWNAYKKGADDAKKSTQDLEAEEKKIRRAIDERSKHMQAAARHQAKVAKEAAVATAMQAAQAKAAGESFKREADEQIAMYGKLAAGLAVAGVALDKLSQRQLEHTNISRNLKISIDEARASTHGMVSDMDLMRQAAMTSAFGITQTSEQFAQFSQVSQKLAARLGIDATTAANDFATALARGSAPILDNMGIVLKVEQAHREYAKSIGKTVAALTEQEKAEAFRKVAMQKALEVTKDVVVDTESSAAGMQRLKVALINAGDAATDFGFKMTDGAVASMSDWVHGVTLGAAGTSKYEAAVASATKEQDRFTLALQNSLKAMSMAQARIDAKTVSDAEAVAMGAKLQGVMAGVTIEADRLQKVGLFQTHNEMRIRAQVAELDREAEAIREMKGSEEQLADVQARRNALIMEELALKGDILGIQRILEGERAITTGGGGGGGGDRFASERAAFEAQLAASQRSQGFGSLDRSTDTASRAFEEQAGPARQQAEMQAAAQAMGDLRREELEQIRSAEEERARIEKAAHAARLQRMKEEAEARKKMIANYVGANEIMNQLAQGSIGLGMEVVAASERSERAKAEIANKMMAGQAFGIGALETVKAAAAFASLNPIQGGMHTAAAALAFAKGGLLASGVIGPMATVGEGSSSINAGGGAGGSSNGPSGGSNAPKGPISRKEDGMQGAHHAPPGGGGGGGNVITINMQSLLPADEEKAGIQIANLLRHSNQSFGSAA